MKRISLAVVLLLFSLWLVSPADGQYGHYQQGHFNHGYGHGAYGHNGYYLYPQPYAVQINPDFYYSVSGYYRDKLLLDAFAGRVQDILSKQAQPQPVYQPPQLAHPSQAYQPQPVSQAPVQKQARASVPTDPRVSHLVQSRCIKCHTGTSARKGVVLDNLDGLTWLQRQRVWRAAHTGEMPEGGEPLTNEEVDMIQAWADQAPRPAWLASQ